MVIRGRLPLGALASIPPVSLLTNVVIFTTALDTIVKRSYRKRVSL